MKIKTVFRILIALALAYVAYDYYDIRQQAICAHSNLTSHIGSGQ